MRRGSVVWLLCLVSGCHPAPASDTRPQRAASGELKVLTFNVNYAGVDMERSARAILRARADVVALQETTPRWESFLRHRLAKAYPYQRYRHAGGAGGQAFLSRVPLRTEGVGAPAAGGWFGAWRVSVRLQGRRIQLLNVHLRPPIGNTGRLSTVASAYFRTRPIRRAEIQAHLRSAPARGPLVVLGDFNESDRGQAVRWLRSRGFTDALYAHDRRTATWQWTTSVGTVRSRLDHVLVRGLRCVGARVLGPAASDHFPVEAVLRLP